MMEDLAQIAIQTMLDAGAEFADIRLERTTEMKLEVVNGEVKTSTTAILKGAGLRAFIGGAWAFAQTSALTNDGMLESGTEVVRIAKLTAQYITEPYPIKSKAYQASVEHNSKITLEDVSIEEKIQLFHNSDIFILPSISDMFPTVVLEAGYCGLPLILSV